MFESYCHIPVRLSSTTQYCVSALFCTSRLWLTLTLSFNDVFRTIGGTTITPRPPQTFLTGLFPVKVECTNSGTGDGNASSAPSYQYTVRKMDWRGSGTSAPYELGTGVTVARPTAAGSYSPQAGSTGYGLAFYDGATLVLWDAGEIPNVGSC